MKTSIFDMNFVLPPVVEMHDVMKDMPMLPMGSKFGFLYLNC